MYIGKFTVEETKKMGERELIKLIRYMWNELRKSNKNSTYTSINEIMKIISFATFV